MAVGILFFCLALRAQQSGVEVGNSFVARSVMMRGEQLPDVMLSFAWRPEVFAELYPRPRLRFSAEISLDNHLDLLFAEPEGAQELHFDLYRAWAAASWQNTELKAGLQHIRIGVAQIYRPLQWFDELVPGAFLQDTKGVMAINLSHFFPAPELRLWALPGSDGSLAGSLQTNRTDNWEYGGRLAFSSFLGETGLNFDRRETAGQTQEIAICREYKFGWDQRVDGFMGGWLEAEFAVKTNETVVPGSTEGSSEQKYSGNATLGGDYTFGLGNGLYALAEVNLLWPDPNANLACDRISSQPADWRAALMLNYPLGLLDSLVLLGTYNDGSEGRLNSSLSWRRTYDRLSWDLTLGYDSLNPLTQSDAAALSLTINYDI